MTGQPPRTVYPGHADYDMAVDNLSRFVFDPVLKHGQPRRRRDGGPLYFLGGFAKAYVIECHGKTFALRVWLSDVGDAARRYAAVSKYCGQARLPIFVEDFTYVPDGILVNGHFYPLLRMEWVKGQSLGEFISGYLSDEALLRAAAQAFLAMVRTLHRAGVAHGDLQSDNMLVSRAPGGAVTFKLIDYDTLMVPALAGLAITSTGLPCYQHPRRGDSGLATVRDDYFAELVIYLSLLAVAENPNLWRQHPAPPVQRDKELLFVPEDFAAPHPTPVFHSLHRHGGLVRSLAVALWNFTRCRSIGDLFPLEGVLEQAEAAHARPAAAEKSAFDRVLASRIGGAGTLPRDLFDDTAFTRPVPVVAPRPATTTTRPAETFQNKVERMAPARPVARPQAAPQSQPRTATGWSLKRWAALAAAVVALIGGWNWLGSGKGKPAAPPTAAEAAANATAAAALGSGSVGTRQVFALGGGQRFAVSYVPAGTFTMGGSGSDETPHSVTLSSPFWMGETEVTQGQWQALMGNNPSNFKGDPNLPVEQVSWNNAQNYVTALNTRAALSNGWHWTLPTEAQWEYACRAGTTGEYAGDLDAMAWYGDNSGSKTHPVGTKKANAYDYLRNQPNQQETHPVGTKMANAYGLSDMHGNVWEWCADWFGDYPKGAVTDPTGPNNGSFRVARGGSWDCVGTLCRSAFRYWYSPGYRATCYGFRVAAVPGERGLAGATVPGSGAGARDERPAPVPVVDVSGAKAGERREADLSGGVKLDLCGIPAGSFTMGGTGSDETQHEVTLTKSFWLGRTEVTQAQWEAVTGKNPSNFKGKDLPVETVSWDDASDFCKKLNAKDLLPAGWRWTLPTEAQWEYACRAGTTGDYAGALDDMAWYDSNSGSKTHPVGTKKANEWGLSDMHGNVWEWCADWYGDYPKGTATDPTGSNDGSNRVDRGGSWDNVGSLCRSAGRRWYSPGFRIYGIGFRVAAVPGGS